MFDLELLKDNLSVAVEALEVAVDEDTDEYEWVEVDFMKALAQKLDEARAFIALFQKAKRDGFKKEEEK